MIKRRAIIWGWIFLIPFFVAAVTLLSLPYEKDESRMLTRGYNNTTHVGKDKYALDFTAGGCDSWDSPILSVDSGTVIQADISHKTGEPNSYGNQVLIEHNNGFVTRYAHLNQVWVEKGDPVGKGQEIGTMGNTGTVFGQACVDHPGTHLHFVLYSMNPDGSLEAHKPEPMSGYTDFVAGKWYTSDNELYDPNDVEEVVDESDEDPSIFDSIINWFTNLFDEPEEAASEPEAEITQPEEEREPKPEPVYNLSLINTSESVTVPASQRTLDLTIEAENIGNTTWQQEDVSLNVVAGDNDPWFHESWVTSLRPALLSEATIEPSEQGSFSTTITLPQDAGEYDFQLQVVRNNNGIFEQLGNQFYTLEVTIEGVVEEEVQIEEVIVETTEQVPEEIEPEEEPSVIETIIDTISDAVDSVTDTVKTFFSSGGGGGGGSTTEEAVVEEVVEEAVEVIPDTTPPTIPTVTATIIAFATPTISIAWSSTDTESQIAHYDMEYAVDSGEWTSLLSETTSTTYDLAADRLSSYSFRARATDSAGNTSDFSDGTGTNVLVDWPKSVVINEVAWMGTSAVKNLAVDCTEHEWIELYNTTDETIDLTGWVLQVDDTQIALSGSIESNGYYLVAKNHTNKDALVDLDIRTVMQNVSMSDSGARIGLVNAAGEIIDELDFSAGWPAGSVTGGSSGNLYQPMARIDAAQPGSVASNWQTDGAIRPFGDTNNCGELLGSPGRENTGMWLLHNLDFYYADKFVSSTITLSPENNPYVLSGPVLSAGKAMIIDPGTVIIGAGPTSFLAIEGAIQSNGTAESPVVFTSGRDTTYGAWDLPDFVAMDNPTTPEAGDWSRIEVRNGGSGTFMHTHFLYGGQEFEISSDGFFAKKDGTQMLRVVGSNVTVDQCTFRDSYINDHDEQYNSMIWAENSTGNGSVSVTNSTFENGHIAITTEEQDNGNALTATIQNNTFTNFSNTDGPVVADDLIGVYGNNIFPDLASGQTVPLGFVTISTDTTINSAYAYSLTGLIVQSGATLTLDPGATMHMAPKAAFQVDGSLQSNGTVVNPVTIDGPDGYWGNMVFNSSNSSLSHTNISGGNNGVKTGSDGGMVWAENSVLLFNSVSILDGRQPESAVRLKNSTTTFSNSTIGWSAQKTIGNTLFGIAIDGGVATLEDTTVQYADYGLYGTGGATVNLIDMDDENFFNIAILDWWPSSLVSSTLGF